MMSLTRFPEKNPPPLGPVIHDVSLGIIGRGNSLAPDPAQITALRTQLEDSGLLSTIQARPNIFAQVRRGWEWYENLERLEEVMPGVTGRTGSSHRVAR